jgi:hypothetical protein
MEKVAAGSSRQVAIDASAPVELSPMFSMARPASAPEPATDSLPPKREVPPKRGDRQYGRSRVTNGKSNFVEEDGRSPWGRRWSDVYAQIISDIGGKSVQGAESQHDDGLSEGQRQLARRATTISIACEKIEGEAAAGHEFDDDKYGMLTDRLGRCLQRLGIKRERRRGPTLSDILRPAP